MFRNKTAPSLLMVIIFLCTQFGCAAAPHRQISQPLAHTRFKPSKIYLIKLHSHKTEFKVKGSQLAIQNDQLLIRSQDNTKVMAYPAHNVERISSRSDERVGSHWLSGLGIGAAAGLAVGAGFGAWGLSHGGHDDDGVGKAIALSSFIGGPIVGGLIGMGIGFAIPKKAKVSITPTISRNANETAAGIGLTMPF